MITTGVVGQRWRASVTPWGGLAPWDDTPPLDWYVAADDRWHAPRHEPTVRQSRVDGTPVAETRLRVPGGDVVQTVYSVADAGGVTVIELANESSLPVAVAFDRREVLTERPIADVPIEGIALPAGAFVMPLGHRARLRIGVAHVRPFSGPLPARLPAVAQVARGWAALADRASRFVLPDGESGAALEQRVVAERCELVLGGVADPLESPVAFLVGAGELARMGELRAGDAVEDTAAAVERLGGDGSWEAGVALAAAARLLAAAGEARAVRDVERLATGRLAAAAPVAIADGMLAVPWLESRFAVGGTLFPGGLPSAWRGRSIEAYGIPTGPTSSVALAVRWHGARPAVLWEQSGGLVRLTSPALAPEWESAAASGEVLWPAPR